MQDALLDPAVGEDGEREHERRLQADELHAAHRRRFDVRADDHRGVGAHPRQELARLVEQVLEHLVRRREEREEVGHDAALRGREPRLAFEVVDEEPVAAVGGDPAGRRVRLHEVALALEDRHVVAHRGARHAETPRPRDGLRSHRLRGGDVLLHDRPEDRGLALVELHWHSILPSASDRRRLFERDEEPGRDLVAEESAPAREDHPVAGPSQEPGGDEVVDAGGHP